MLTSAYWHQTKCSRGWWEYELIRKYWTVFGLKMALDGKLRDHWSDYSIQMWNPDLICFSLSFFLPQRHHRCFLFECIFYKSANYRISCVVIKQRQPPCMTSNHNTYCCRHIHTYSLRKSIDFRRFKLTFTSIICISLGLLFLMKGNLNATHWYFKQFCVNTLCFYPFPVLTSNADVHKAAPYRNVFHSLVWKNLTDRQRGETVNCSIYKYS